MNRAIYALAAVIVVIAIVLARYEMISLGPHTAYRLDRLTGEVVFFVANKYEQTSPRP